MFSRFFIHRPIFAAVLSIVIVVLGLLALPALPVEQTPDITPPTVQVQAVYPGASGDVVAEAVAQPLEQEINGVEGMIYLDSKCTQDGAMTLTVTFEVGTDIDMATVLVQNRVATALPSLPDVVKQLGVTTQKKSTAMVQMVNLISPGGEYDQLFLSNYAGLRIRDVLRRTPGVGDVLLMGAKDFSMRVWLDPDRLESVGLTSSDVLAAVREQNVQVAAGSLGATPNEPDQRFQYSLRTQGRLKEAHEFEQLVVKTGEDGRLVRLGDVARVELGAENYATNVRLNGLPSVGLAIYQLPGANALDVAASIGETMEELAERFPPGLEYRIAFDTTEFVVVSIQEVLVTLLVALVLVVLTVYVFLQDLRTTLIPTVTIPVSLIGTLAVMLALGMSINTLSLFGLVLAIGIVVDDSIVVVENTMRLIDEEGLGARAAAERAMLEISGPVVATTLVLLSVFVPTAMLGGITGRLYSQFAVTISVATVFSSINALTLSPALCGLLLRPTPAARGLFFRGFNRAFDAGTRGYMAVVRLAVRRAGLSMAAFGGLMFLTYESFTSLPTGFLPNEDQGYLFVDASLPEAATLQRTTATLEEISGRVAAMEGVRDVIAIDGFSFLSGVNATSAGSLIITLDSWGERSPTSLRDLIMKLQPELYMRTDAVTFAFIPPPIMGLGAAGGFTMKLEDRGAEGPEALQRATRDLIAAANAEPGLARISTDFTAETPQYFLDVDREKAKRMGIPLSDLFGTLQANLGSAYVNDFAVFGQTFKVYAQADAPFRMRVEDIGRLEVRTRDGEMVPLSALVEVREAVGPKTVFRYNLYPAATVSGTAAAGLSSGEAVGLMQRLAEETLPPSMGYEWSGTTFQEQRSSGQMGFVFGLAILMVFLVLAAQYESWSIPFAVILSVPLGLLGAAGATWLRRFDSNVYTQIGIVLLIGLAAKSAILIVEFAKARREEGCTIVEAALSAAQLRFRAILMTAFSFILGVIPLAIATGAGAMARQTLGTAVLGGMVVATVGGVFLIPVMYRVVQGTAERLRGEAAAQASSQPADRPAQ